MNPFERDWKSSEVNVNVKVVVNPPLPSTCSSEGYTDVTILLDRSSSMMPLRKAAVEALNENFAKMRETPGDTRWTMVQFDDPDSAKGAKEVFPKTVFEHRSEKEMTPLKVEDFKPRGTTALVDAVCMSMQQIDARTSGRENVVKPIMMIVTDGLENSSKEFTSAKMREMIAARQERGWDFLFLATNQDAWTEAGRYGLDRTTAASHYNYTGCSVLSGGMAADARNAFNFEATAAGMRTAIASGMMGCAHMVSGRVPSHV